MHARSACFASRENHFALQELIIMTVIFYRHLRFRLEPVSPPVEMDPLITLRPKQSIRMKIERRRASVVAQTSTSAGNGDFRVPSPGGNSRVEN